MSSEDDETQQFFSPRSPSIDVKQRNRYVQYSTQPFKSTVFQLHELQSNPTDLYMQPQPRIVLARLLVINLPSNVLSTGSSLDSPRRYRPYRRSLLDLEVLFSLRC
jgi:hypothetical protein